MWGLENKKNRFVHISSAEKFKTKRNAISFISFSHGFGSSSTRSYPVCCYGGCWNVR